MTPDAGTPAKETKGERTTRRIMDVAEDLFAEHGYDGTSLRQIADGAGIKEPGLYNHFAGKQALYEAVLFRALNPMAEALSSHLEDASGLRDYTELPAIMTDLLLAHPQMAAFSSRPCTATVALLATNWSATGLKNFLTRACRAWNTRAHRG